MTNPRRFWLNEARLWTLDAVRLVSLRDWPSDAPPHIPQTQAGVYAMYSASDYFKAYPDRREVPAVQR